MRIAADAASLPFSAALAAADDRNMHLVWRLSILLRMYSVYTV